jgi:hypothetical protein
LIRGPTRQYKITNSELTACATRACACSINKRKSLSRPGDASGTGAARALKDVAAPFRFAADLFFPLLCVFTSPDHPYCLSNLLRVETLPIIIAGNLDRLAHLVQPTP